MSKFGGIIDRKIPLKNSRKQTLKSTLVKKQGKVPGNALPGRVISVTGKNFLVGITQNDILKFIECISAGTIQTEHEESSLIVVGDFVKIIPPNEFADEKLGKIIWVETRKTWMSRKPLLGYEEDIIAANSEQLLIIMSAEFPVYNKRVIDRLIVAAEIGNLKTAICINKIDLGSSISVGKDLSAYKKIGYKIIYTSFLEKKGLKALEKYLKNKETILIGPSGVGKSSLVNCLLKSDIQKIKEISEKHLKGKHTTSAAKMFELPFGGRIIDTPGIKEFGIVKIEKEELTLYFHDFDDYYDNCRFMPCSHTHEPHCAVKEAVEAGLINEERYMSYLNIYDSL